jgi:hypothetical protein
MDDYGHVDSGQEYAELDHGHAEQGYDADHALNASQYGEATSHESDQHYAHGHHEEYESPSDARYSETDYTNLDAHEADSHAAFGTEFAEANHNEAFENLDHLHQELGAEHYDATRYGDDGQQEISAVSK